jgi:hypothetical protein
MVQIECKNTVILQEKTISVTLKLQTSSQSLWSACYVAVLSRVPPATPEGVAQSIEWRKELASQPITGGDPTVWIASGLQL